MRIRNRVLICAALAAGAFAVVRSSAQQPVSQKRPNMVMLMTDDTGWNDFGVYTGDGAALGHPTPHDRLRKVDHQFPEYQAVSWRSVERLTSEPSESE